MQTRSSERDFEDSEEMLFWRSHLRPLSSVEEIEELCARARQESHESFERHLAAGELYEEDRAALVFELAEVRRWWARHLLEKAFQRTSAEVEWARRVLAERWF